jgi:molybdopterin-guanine dinucleotide biosynthesis protein
VKIVAVVGTGSGCGKTTVACRILRAIPGMGAVKISPREGESRVEWGAGEPGKDTDLYHGSGAVRVARIIGPRDAVGASWERVKGRFEDCRGVVIEGTRSLEFPDERFVVFVMGDTSNGTREQENRAMMTIADVIVDRSSHLEVESLTRVIRTFLDGSANDRV